MRILFQGDSITDAGRDRSDYHDLGEGYPKYAAEAIVSKYPDEDFEFINLGISGNQTADLVDRLQSDFIDIQPDFVSILIGINDTWHRAENREWLSGEEFETIMHGNELAPLDVHSEDDSKPTEPSAPRPHTRRSRRFAGQSEDR